MNKIFNTNRQYPFAQENEKAIGAREKLQTQMRGKNTYYFRIHQIFSHISFPFIPFLFFSAPNFHVPFTIYNRHDCLHHCPPPPFLRP